MTDYLAAAKLSVKEAERAEAHRGSEERSILTLMRDELLLANAQASIAIAEKLSEEKAEPYKFYSEWVSPATLESDPCEGCCGAYCSDEEEGEEFLFHAEVLLDAIETIEKEIRSTQIDGRMTAAVKKERIVAYSHCVRILECVYDKAHGGAARAIRP